MRRTIEIDRKRQRRTPTRGDRSAATFIDDDHRSADGRHQAAGRAINQGGVYHPALMAAPKARPRIPRPVTQRQTVGSLMTESVRTTNRARRRAWSAPRGRRVG